jgi:hypothetical protein
VVLWIVYIILDSWSKKLNISYDPFRTPAKISLILLTTLTAVYLGWHLIESI